MPEITLTSVNKYATRELTSGDIIISFHVDRSMAKELLPYHLLTQDTPLRLNISDGEEQPDKPEDQKQREKLYAKIQIHSDAIGYSEGAMRTAFKNLVGKESRIGMTMDELIKVEGALYSESMTGEPDA